MFNFWRNSCGMCNIEKSYMVKYVNRSGVKMVFCQDCKKYAEKRSFRIVKRYGIKKISTGGLNVQRKSIKLTEGNEAVLDGDHVVIKQRHPLSGRTVVLNLTHSDMKVLIEEYNKYMEAS